MKISLGVIITVIVITLLLVGPLGCNSFPKLVDRLDVEAEVLTKVSAESSYYITFPPITVGIRTLSRVIVDYSEYEDIKVGYIYNLSLEIWSSGFSPYAVLDKYKLIRASEGVK